MIAILYHKNIMEEYTKYDIYEECRLHKKDFKDDIYRPRDGEKCLLGLLSRVAIKGSTQSQNHQLDSTDLTQIITPHKESHSRKTALSFIIPIKN